MLSPANGTLMGLFAPTSNASSIPFPKSVGKLIRVADDSAGHLKPASGRDIDSMSFPSCSFDTLSTVFLALVRTATSITTAKVTTVPSSEALWSEGSKGSSECRQTQACPFAQSSYLEDCRKANHAWVSWTSALYLSILTPSGNIPFAARPFYLPITTPPLSHRTARAPLSACLLSLLFLGCAGIRLRLARLGLIGMSVSSSVMVQLGSCPDLSPSGKLYLSNV